MSGLELRVDLDAFAENLRVVRDRVAPAELMLVVKDDAYAHGLDRIVRRASVEGVRWFGAFDVHEALRTRRAAGPRPRVLSWLSVEADEIEAALDADIDVGVGDAEFLEEVASAASGRVAPARVHLKIDTGLHRNGIRAEDWQAAIARAAELQRAGSVRIVGVWSHIAEASDREDDAARAVFDGAVRHAEDSGLGIEIRHLAASAASFARAEFRYDVVRVGAFCYGVRSAGGASEPDLGIRPVASLVAPVTGVSRHDVTLGVGSLHGLPSTLAGHASLRVHGERRPIRAVAETHLVADAWPGAAVGEEITVFGAGGGSATDLAETIGTVGEEILVRVSPLVPRSYSGA